MDEGSITVATGVVVVYFSRFGKPLQTHHKVVLDLGAKAIAKLKGYEFGGHYDAACDYSGPLFFVPDDTLLLDEASRLGIRSPNDLYGGVVPRLRPCDADNHPRFPGTRISRGRQPVGNLTRHNRLRPCPGLCQPAEPGGLLAGQCARA